MLRIQASSRSGGEAERAHIARGRRARAITALVLAAVMGSSIASAAIAAPVDDVSLVPENAPGVPEAPVVLYEEDFESISAVTTLTDYASADGVAYAADPYWSSTEACNGFITRYSLPRPSDAFCTDDTQYELVQAKAYALGMLAPDGRPEDNAALSTNSNPSSVPAFVPGAVQFATASDIELPSAAGRFVTFSVDAAATDCVEAHPLLRFYLLDDGVEVPVSDTPIDPCEQATTSLFAPGLSLDQSLPWNEVFYGSFAADSSLRLDGSSFGIVLRNEATDVSGNDGAIDNIRVLDVTPRLDVTAQPGTAVTGGVTRLIFTVTNTSELAAKEGWSFDAQLPTGVRFASGDVLTTCAEESMSVGSSSLVFSARLDAGIRACELSVPVTADRAGDYLIDASAIGITGLDEPEDATVRFADAALLLTTSAGAPVDLDGDGLLAPGDSVALYYLITNSGGVTVDDLGVIDVLGDVVCPSALIAPGDSVTCERAHALTAEELDAGVLASLATASGTAVGGGSIASAPVSLQVPLPAPSAGLALTATVQPGSVIGSDALVDYRVVLRNTGTAPVSDVRIERADFSGTGVSGELRCDPVTAPLLPDATIDCSLSYRTSADDVRSGAVLSTFAAEGVSVADGTVVSASPVLAVLAVGEVVAGEDGGIATPTPAGSTSDLLPSTGSQWFGAVALLALLLALIGTGIVVVRRRPARV